MSTEDVPVEGSELDEVMADIRRELVLRVAHDDREANRELYDRLEHE